MSSDLELLGIGGATVVEEEILETPELEVEEQAEQLRRQAQAKLDGAKEKLQEAKRDLESSMAADSGPPHQRNPFGRTRASLRAMANELQAAPAPVLSRESEQPKE